MKAIIKETKSKKPCGGCPFKRDNTPCSSDTDPSHPGGSHPFVYLGQIHGPFWLPCHQDKNYEGVGSDIAEVNQCRGAAIFRTNVGVADRMPNQLLSLPEDKDNVFANEAEFAHHYLKSGNVDWWKKALTEEQLTKFTHHEMNKQSDTRRYYDVE